MSDAREPSARTSHGEYPASGRRSEQDGRVSDARDSGKASPRRVVVTSPRTRATRSATRTAVARDINEQTRLGEVYIRSLMRAQMRLAVMTGSGLGVLLVGLPLLFALVPSLREVRVFGLPLPWLLLGVVVYPVLVAGGWFYVRHAERNEREFARLVERS